MSYKITNQKGFTAIEAVLIVVILAIIGGTGYYVYQANNKSTDTQNTAQLNAESAVPHKAAGKTTYTTITEWGVRAPYSGSLKLQYTLSSDGKQADFTSDKLVATDAACTDQFGGQIDRYAPADIATPDGTGTTTAKDRAATASKSTYAYVGGYYYFFTHSQAACGTDPDKTKTVQQQTNAAVEALVPKLQTVPAQ